MKSLYTWIIIAMMSTSSLALLAFTMISGQMETEYVEPVFQAMDELQIEDARDALSTGGRIAVARYLSRLDRLFGTRHYLLSAGGLDVVSGDDRSAWLARQPATESRGFVGARFVVSQRSQDGRYWFLSVGPQVEHGWTFIPYYEVVVGAAALLCVLAAVGVVVPIRRLAALVDRFGRGELAVRSSWRRCDEIGRLGRAFDDMADRLERLVVGERRLLEDVSHELRSPLARLKLAVKLARTSADPLSALDRVDRHLDRMAAVTAEIVEMIRIEGEPHTQRWEDVDLDQVVAEVVADCRTEADPRMCGIRVEGRLAAAVTCDRELLHRAFENVLRNAIRYSAENGSIEVVLREEPRHASITVRDHGSGVPEEALERIFEPFFRVDEARARDRGGVGLGLSIAKRAVALHRGTITARNAAPGLSVAIKLPRSPTHGVTSEHTGDPQAMHRTG